LRHFLEAVGRIEVLALQSGDVGNFEPKLVCQAKSGLDGPSRGYKENRREESVAALTL